MTFNEYTSGVYVVHRVSTRHLQFIDLHLGILSLKL